jgi:uncharacterized protein (TIGR02145 family)
MNSLTPRSLKTTDRLVAVALAVVILAGCDAQNAFTDPRDGKTYRTVRIWTQTWMAENLNYQTDSSWCYDNKDSNCNKYGRLYDWDAAKTACPTGWHLPTWKEWKRLVYFVGSTETAGRELKSKMPDWDGRDNYGFSAMPGGYRSTIEDEPFFRDFSSHGNYWSVEQEDGASIAIGLRWGFTNADYYVFHKRYGFSVRCLRD